MNVKKLVLPLIISAVLFTSIGSCPVYAEDGGANSSGGFLNGLSTFFSRIFGGNTQSMKKDESYRMQKDASSSADQRMMRPNEATIGGQMMGEEYRLTMLVKSGKITEVQKTAILAKMKSIQDELQYWAMEQGIDPSLVMLPSGGPTGMGVMMKEGSGAGMMRPAEKPMQGSNTMRINDKMRVPDAPAEKR